MDANTTDRSVTGIIAAFRASLQEFRNYRERKRKVKKSTAHTNHKRLKSKEEDSNGDELLLSHSLRQGAIDVQREYDRHYRQYGDRYAVGDATAHSSLGRTLRKLNTCFQNIIAALLQKDTKIDYKYLTSVSDISRHEALDTLSQLSFRVSQSEAMLRYERGQEKQHKRQRSSDTRGRQKLPSTKSTPDVASVKSGKKGQPVVRKVHLKSASSPQLAMVRPKPKRSGSSKSEVSFSVKEVAPPAKHRRQDSAVSINPPIPSSAGKHTRKDSAVSMNPPFSPPVMIHELPAVPVPASPPRRRQDKITPSMHTFASASTRLGEIPELKWSIPCDYEAMARLNKEHGGRPWPPPPEPMKPRRGFLSLFKKSEFKTAEVAA